MSIKLRAAVESTIEKRHAAGTACCPPLDLDRFFAAMMNLLKGQAAMQPDLDASAGLYPRSCGAPSQVFRIKRLSRPVKDTRSRGMVYKNFIR
jgi:hypothetical protein